MSDFERDSTYRFVDGPRARTGWIPIPLTNLLGVSANAVQATLSNVKRQTVAVPLATLRESVSDDIPGNAATPPGGILTKNTTPNLEFTNGVTDSAIRLDWSTGNSDPVTFQLALPDDLDDTQDFLIKFQAAMGGATDTPVVDADTFFDVGDTKVEDASGAVTGTAVAEYTITVAAADVPAGASTVSVELTPGAHATDTLLIYSLRVEYFTVVAARLETVNGDTDSQIRLTWPASNSNPVAFNTPLPPDLDPSDPILLNLYTDMSGSTDTPVVAADTYFNVGDTKVEDNSSAVGATPDVATITIAAADIPTWPLVMACELTPGAHATDDLHLYALWLEYTRK